MAFLLRMPTDEEIAEAEAAILARIKSGVRSTTTDGLSVSLDSPGADLEALEELEKRDNRTASSSRPHFGLRLTKLIPPECG